MADIIIDKDVSAHQIDEWIKMWDSTNNAITYTAGTVTIDYYQLIQKILHKKSVSYVYRKPGCFSNTSIWFRISLYSKEELVLVDSLFNNLDEGNLQIIKAILNSKFKKNDNETI